MECFAAYVHTPESGTSLPGLPRPFAENDWPPHAALMGAKYRSRAIPKPEG